MRFRPMEALVAARLGVAVVPTPRPHGAEPAAVYVPLTDPGAKRPIGLLWRKELTLSPVARRFADFVRSSDWR